MELYKPNPKITSETILSYLSQKEIMEHYLGISVDTRRGKFRSPLRKDKHPTCNFFWDGNKLLFRDWAKSKPLDCFGVVMEKYNVIYPEALKIVAKDFDLVHNIKTGKAEKRNISVDFTSDRNNEKCNIKVKIQSFTKDNISYLTSYHISSDICNKFNVYSPKYVWINNIIRYVYDDNNPALAYYFGLDERGNQKWKIYFYRKDEGTRFFTNTNRINGWIQLPDQSDHLIITKSLKDVMCLDIFDIPAIAMQAESQTPYDYIIKGLKNRFNNIISLFDYDDAGITRANVLKEKYNIPYYFIKDSEAKDFSDYINIYGKQEAQQLTEEILCV